MNESRRLPCFVLLTRTQWLRCLVRDHIVWKYGLETDRDTATAVSLPGFFVDDERDEDAFKPVKEAIPFTHDMRESRFRPGNSGVRGGGDWIWQRSRPTS